MHATSNKPLSIECFYPARACASKGLCDRSWRLYIVVVYYIFTPRAHARARGYVIGRGVYYILYIIYYILL